MRRTLAIVVVLAAPFAAAGAGIMGSGIGDGGANIVGGAITGASIAPAAAAGLVIDPATTFWLYPDYTGSGPTKLDDTLSEATFSASLTQLVTCRGTDAGSSTWVCGGAANHTFTSPGTPQPNYRPDIFSDGAKSVALTTDVTTRYNAANTSFGDIEGVDFIAEIVALSRGGSNYAAKKTNIGNPAGWVLYSAGGGTNTFRLNVGDGVSNTVVQSGSSLEPNWFHGICFWKYNDAAGGQCFLDGQGGTAVTTVNETTGTSNSATMSIAGTSFSSVAGGLSLLHIWTAPAGTIDNAERQAIASKRAAKFWGTYAVSAAGQAYPTTTTRATMKHVDMIDPATGVRTLFRVSKSAITISRRKELAGGEYVKGILIEPSHTNLALQSETFANASWTENNIDAVSEGSTTAVDQAATADTLESTDGAGSVEHFMWQAITLTAATYTASAYVKAGAGSPTHAWVRDNTVANAIGWINLSTCAAGTKGAGASQLHAENWGNGWCRVGITFTGTVAAHDIDIGYSNADNVTAYDDGTNANSDLIVWGAQVEAQTLPLSYVPTTTASATSNADDLRYNTTSNVSLTGMTMSTSYLSQPNTVGAPYGMWQAYFDANNSISVQGDSSRRAEFIVSSGGVTQCDMWLAGSNVLDGERHTLHGYATANQCRGYFDGTAMAAEDTTVTMPVSGATNAMASRAFAFSAIYWTGLISNVHIYNDVRTP